MYIDPPASAAQFQSWLATRQHGAMAYLQRNAAKRVDPQRFFGDAITAQSELIGATWAPLPARYETHHTH